MNGLYFCFHNKEYFLITNKTRRTRDILKIFVRELFKDTNKPLTMIDQVLNNNLDYKYLMGCIFPATLERVDYTGGFYHKIYGKNFNYGYPADDFTVKIIQEG